MPFELLNIFWDSSKLLPEKSRIIAKTPTENKKLYFLKYYILKRNNYQMATIPYKKNDSSTFKECMAYQQLAHRPKDQFQINEECVLFGH